jgi:tetratricopeptide (TPR) repeat protein
MNATVVAAGARSALPVPAGTAGGGRSQSAAVEVDPEIGALRELVQRIMTADYEGDRGSLDRLYQEADAYLGKPAVESRVRYWKGFAKWRRAMNGANEDPSPGDLVADLDRAVVELRRSGDLDPGFADARIGEMQCLGLVLFFDRSRAGNSEHVARLRELMADLKETAADNPRYVWAWGMAFFGQPPEKGGGPENVIEAYMKALEGIRKGMSAPKTPLDPSWGEAELYVNLAYSYLNRPSPDVAQARRYVDQAIRLVPNWHYARDILRPQIEAAAGRDPGSEAFAR